MNHRMSQVHHKTTPTKQTWYQKCGCLASHIQSTCNLQYNSTVSLEYPQTSSTVNVPYSGREKKKRNIWTEQMVWLSISWSTWNHSKRARYMQYIILAILLRYEQVVKQEQTWWLCQETHWRCVCPCTVDTGYHPCDHVECGPPHH